MMPRLEETTIAENMIAAMLREINDGDVLLEGIGTFLPTAGYLLAQCTHAPNSIRLCPVGNVFVDEGHKLSCVDYEFEVLRRSVLRFDYWDVNGAYLPHHMTGRKGGWKEFLRPAQIDATGRTNNVVIGPYEAPRVRLPGAAGLPDGLPLEPALYMYVPRHDRKTFVPRVDFVSGPGLEDGANPHMIVTNLAVMRFADGGMLEVETLMPGATPEEVQDNTGFDMHFAQRLKPFVPLSLEALALLREEIDPQSLRDLELQIGEERLDAIRRLAQADPAHARLRHTLRALAST
jgi:acyl CoA:acetate/3-ketoacid CoA transferase beta subunit